MVDDTLTPSILRVSTTSRVENVPTGIDRDLLRPIDYVLLGAFGRVNFRDTGHDINVSQ